jgi:AcrR family transcriptional regulator
MRWKADPSGQANMERVDPDMREPTPGKKKQILAAAATLLSRLGIQALSFENIASEAGLSRQLVRYYYADIEGLLVDLCDHLGNGYRETLVGGVLQLGRIERLKFFLDFFFDQAEGYPMPANLEAYDAMFAYAVGSTAVRNRMCGQYRMLGHVISHELAIAHPELGEAACEELSFMFVSMMHAHWSFVGSLRHAREHGRLARRAIDRLIQSYIADSTDTPVIAKPWTRDE